MGRCEERKDYEFGLERGLSIMGKQKYRSDLEIGEDVECETKRWKSKKRLPDIGGNLGPVTELAGEKLE